MIDNVLATCMHVMRFPVNWTMRTSIGDLTFHRNILNNVPTAETETHWWKHSTN